MADNKDNKGNIVPPWLRKHNLPARNSDGTTNGAPLIAVKVYQPR